MSFFARLFRQKKTAPTAARKPSDPKDGTAVDRSVPARSAGDALSDLRRQARTGDPKLKGRHQSGSF